MPCLIDVSKLGLVLSRFEFNELPNLNFKAGAFELQACRTAHVCMHGLSLRV